MNRRDKTLMAFGVVGVVAGATAYALEFLVRNPFLVGVIVQAAILLAVFRIASSVCQAGAIPNSRWLLAACVLFGIFIGTNLLATRPGPVPEQMYDSFSILFGLSFGLGVILSVRLLTNYWSILPAAGIVAVSAGLIYAQLFSDSALADRLIYPVWILVLSLFVGWWFVEQPRMHKTQRA